MDPKLATSKLKKTAMSAAVAFALGVPATAMADEYAFSYSGIFTMLSAAGNAMTNTSPPHASNEWSGVRTNITGTMLFDTDTGAGSITVLDFDFFDGTSPAQAQGIVFKAIGNGGVAPFQAIGNGLINSNGPLVLGNMLFNWNGTSGIPVSIVWNAAGIFGALQAAVNPLRMAR